MLWDVEFTDEFGDWWETLSADEQDEIDVAVALLEQREPRFKREGLIDGS